MEKNAKRLIIIVSVGILILLLNVIELSPSSPPIRRSVLEFAEGATMPAVVKYNVRDVEEPTKGTDTPLYWHIHKASGSGVISYYSCMGLALATKQGTQAGHDKDEELAVWENFEGKKYVNVDTRTPEGISRAKELGLAESGLADVVFTSLVPAAMDMFNPNHQARFFALFRHPIDREVSLFYYKQIASWEKNEWVYQPELAEIPIETYYEQRKDDKNSGMIGTLLGKGRITEDDLELAKEILRTKALVGLTSKMEESVNRFDAYFGWDKNVKRDTCQDTYIRRPKNSNPHKKIEEGSKVWEYLSNIFHYDIKLYEYAEELFEEQAMLFDNRVDLLEKE